jgi:hypothetical protein
VWGSAWSLLWCLSNWSAFLGAQRSVLKPYFLYSFLASSPCFASSAVPMWSPFYIVSLMYNNLFMFRNFVLCTMFRCAAGPTQAASYSMGTVPATSACSILLTRIGMRGTVSLLHLYAFMACTGTSSPFTFLYRKRWLLDREEEGIVILWNIGENIPINLT